MSANYYQILGLGPGATLKEIRKNYIKLALIHHPDKGGSAEKFQKFDEAYKHLIVHHSSLPAITSIDDLEEVTAKFVKEVDEIEGEFCKYGLKWVSEADTLRLRKMAISLIETRFSLLNVSPQDLPPQAWHYGLFETKSRFNNWKEAIEGAISNQELKNFFSRMTFEIDQVAGYLNTSDSSGRKPLTYEKNKKPDQSTPPSGGSQNESNQNPPPSGNDKNQDNQENNQNSDNPQQNNNSNKDKDEKISQLETEIKQLKNQNSGTQTPEQQAKNQKKIEEKEKELEEVKRDKENNQGNSQTDDNKDYENWTHERLVKEIKKLKVEIEKLKKSSDINNIKKQKQLQAKLEKLEKIKSGKRESLNKSDNKFPIGWVVGGGIIVVALGFVVILVIRKHKKITKIKTKK